MEPATAKRIREFVRSWQLIKEPNQKKRMMPDEIVTYLRNNNSSRVSDKYGSEVEITKQLIKDYINRVSSQEVLMDNISVCMVKYLLTNAKNIEFSGQTRPDFFQEWQQVLQLISKQEYPDSRNDQNRQKI